MSSTSPGPEFEDAAGHLVARLLGEFSPENFIRQIQAAVQACLERGRRRLLVDVTRVDGLPSTLDRFEMGYQGAAAAAELERVSVLARADQIDSQKFGVLVARNRGLMVDIFSDLARAEAWLRTEPDDAALLAGFEGATLPREAWTHRAHVRTACLLLRRGESIERFKSCLKALNAAHGTPESLTRGYHETLTQAWWRVTAAALREGGPAADSVAFLERHPELARKERLEPHYSRERLFSPEAKASFVEPDRAPLPPLVN